MRQIGNRLHCTLKDSVVQLVDQKGQYYRRGKHKNQIEQRQDEGIAEQAQEGFALEDMYKMLQSDPFAVEKPGPGIIILEGNNQAGQRKIFKNKDQQQAGQQKQIQLIIAQDFPPGTQTADRPVTLARRTGFFHVMSPQVKNYRND